MTTPALEGAATEPAEPQQDGPQPQEAAEVDWKAKAREWERRAKDNKSAADELAALKQAQMSEAERTAARLAELEREATQARTEALRFKVAARFGIDDGDADLFLTGSDEPTITRQAERLKALGKATGGPKPDPSQGSKPAGSEMSGKDAGRAEAQRRFGSNKTT